MARIEEKIEKGQTEVIAEPVEEPAKAEEAKVIDIMDLLKRSLEETGKGRSKAKRRPRAGSRSGT
jgi:non-homologous end joining protein Ku